MKIDVEFDLRLIMAAVIIGFLVLMALASVAILVPTDSPTVNFVYRRFRLDSEQSIPALFSFILLLVCSLLLATVAMQQRGTRSRWHLHWVGLACLFLLMAYDEAASLHESLINPLQEQLGGGGVLYFAWVIPGLAFTVLIGAIYVPFLMALPSIFRNLFVLSGVIYVTGALGMEMVGARYFHQDLVDADSVQILTDRNYLIITTIEESMEMMGALLFIYSLMRFLTAQSRTLTFRLHMNL